MTSSLDQIFIAVVESLDSAVSDRNHGWRTPSLATISNKDTPAQRMIVVRSFDRETQTTTCVTDRRSAKVREIIANSEVSLLYWDAPSQRQLRVCATASLVEDSNQLERAWDRAPQSIRSLFVTRDNFVVLAFTANRFEQLELSTSPHRRSAFDLFPGSYQASWLTP